MITISTLCIHTKKPWFYYFAPFVVFLLITELANIWPEHIAALYTLKTVIVGGLLFNWRKEYARDFGQPLTPSAFLFSLGCGVLVLVIWIVPEQLFFTIGEDRGFNPYELSQSAAGAYSLLFIRLLGASLVVPIMEELFWRSFLMRYLIDRDFLTVPIGSFSWFSFLSVALLFGAEHHRIVVGIIAGFLYGGLLLWQKNIKGVIIAHAVTNLGLGVYVLLTGNWYFW